MGYGLDIKPIPKEERIYGFSDNFNIWFGAGISIAEFWAGAVLIYALGLNLPTALLAIILGHIIGTAIFSMIGVMGYDAGVPTMVLTRKSLGYKGSVLASMMNYIQLIGWTAVMLIVTGRAMDTIVTNVAKINVELTPIFVVFTGAVVIWWSIIGPQKWKFIEKVSAILLAVLVIWLTAVLLLDYDVVSLLKAPIQIDSRFWIAVDLVVAMPVSWAPLIADYTRFSRSRKSAFFGSYLGYFISSALFYSLGALSNIIAGLPDPIGIISYFGLGIPAMLLVIFSTTTTTFLDVYSAAITMKNVFEWVDVKRQIIYAGILGTILGLVFPIEQYEWFLLIIGGAFTSLSGVMICDYLLDRDSYEKWSGFKAGIDRIGVAIWLLGFIAYMLLASSSIIPSIQIPLFSELGNLLGSTLVTIALTIALMAFFKGNKSVGLKAN